MPQHHTTSTTKGPTESQSGLLSKVIEEPIDDLKVSFQLFNHPSPVKSKEKIAN